MDLADFVRETCTNERHFTVDDVHDVRIRYPDACQDGVGTLGPSVVSAVERVVEILPRQDTPGTVTLFVVENRRSPPNFRWEHATADGSVGFLVMPHTCRDDAWASQDDVVRAVAVALHEFVHAQVHRGTEWKRAPAWIVEGFATYASARASATLAGDFATHELLERGPLLRFLEADVAAIEHAARLRVGFSSRIKTRTFLDVTSAYELFHGMFLAMEVAGEDPALAVARYEAARSNGSRRAGRRASDELLDRLIAGRPAIRSTVVKDETRLMSSAPSRARALLARVRVAALDGCSPALAIDAGQRERCAEPRAFALLARCVAPDALVEALDDVREHCSGQFDVAYAASADSLAASNSVLAARQALDVIETDSSPLSRQYAAVIVESITTIGTAFDAADPESKRKAAVAPWRRWIAERENRERKAPR